MDLLWMILPVILVCAEAQKVTEVKVELGQNITLTCSGDKTDTYWYTEIHSQVRGFISRSFLGDSSSTLYYVYTFSSKYSALENSLRISNITAEDCRLYFCAKRQNDNIQFVDTFSLLSDVTITPSTNKSEVSGSLIWQTDLITYISFSLNIFLFLVIIGLVGVLLCLKKKRINNDQLIGRSPVIYENTKRLRATKKI